MRTLFEKGARYGTVMDLGCADGHFSLCKLLLGVVRGRVPITVDANPMYGGSRNAIKNALGGHFVIAAVGETEMTHAVHPHWSSLRPPNDL